MLAISRWKAGLRSVVLAAITVAAVSNANAHQVWLEQDVDGGPVRVYLGEPGVPDTGDKIDKLKGAEVFTDSRDVLTVLSQEDDHWQGAVTGQGDVRLFSDSVWEPWGIGGGEWWKFWDDQPEKLQGAILQARAGRMDATAQLTYELVPTTAGGNVFVALFEGSPLADKEVLLLSPSKKEVALKTDVDGKVDVSSSLTEPGRFVLESAHTVDVDAMHSGKKITSLMYISTLSFIAP